MINLVEAATDEVVINEGRRNIDFRVETDNFDNMFFVKGFTDNVGVNTSTPNIDYDLDVEGNIECTSVDETSDERVKTLISTMGKTKVKQFCENISIWLFSWNDYSYLYENYTECEEQEYYNESSEQWENYTICYNLTRKIGIDFGDETDNYDVGIPAQSLFQYVNESFGEDYAHALVHVPDNEDVELWNVNYKSVSLIFSRYTQILAEEVQENSVMLDKLVRWAGSLPEPYTFDPDDW